jgi:FkbM family methyltransferase
LADIVHGWNLPDNDVHFVAALNAAVAAGHPPDYQPAHRAAALKHVRRFGVALDVGAHIGFWSRDLSQRFNVVHAFEPSSRYRPLLALNAPDVIVHPYALGTENREGSLAFPPGNSGAAFIAVNIEGEEPIEIRRLDDHRFPDVDYIKLDCEGYELPVLSGGKETILRHRPLISIEQKIGSAGRFDNGRPQYAARDFLIHTLDYKPVARVVDDWILAPKEWD